MSQSGADSFVCFIIFRRDSFPPKAPILEEDFTKIGHGSFGGVGVFGQPMLGTILIGAFGGEFSARGFEGDGFEDAPGAFAIDPRAFVEGFPAFIQAALDQKGFHAGVKSK